MLRSLSASVSGMKNHQTLLDVISNNIANVNTVGFKASRVTFENAMNQTLKGASRPVGEGGGTNPMQVGMGLGLGSIDTLMSQGNLKTTGNTTDLAIEGDSFFSIASGDKTCYTRDGSFQIDSTGAIVHSTNGYVLQGKMANDRGEVESGTNIGDIVIPYSAQSPAKASTEIKVSQNLDSDAEALGTVLHTQSYLATATDGSGTGVRATDDPLVNLYKGNGDSLNLKDGETLTISYELMDPSTGNSTGTQTATLDIVGTDQTNPPTKLSDLMTSIKNAVDGYDGNSNVDVVLNPDGTIGVTNNDGSGRSLKNLQIISNGLRSKAPVSDVFRFGTTIKATESDNSKALRAAATSDDTISSLFTNNGAEMGFESADTIDIVGSIGGENIPDIVSQNVGIDPVLGGNKISGGTGMNVSAGSKIATSATSDFISAGVNSGDIIEINGVGYTVETVDSATQLTLTKAPGTAISGGTFEIGGAKMQDLMDSIRDAFSLSEQDDSADANQSVSMDEAGSDDKMPDGSIIIRGRAGSAFKLEKVTIRGIDTGNDNNPAPTNFTQNMSMTEYQTARDFGEYDTSIEVYDETGDAHTVIVKFTHTGQNGEWEWEANLAGQEKIVSGNRGRVYFNADGTPASWTFADKSASFIFDPANGSERVNLSFDFGKPGETGGLTQFSSDTTVTASEQDGYTTGRLENITINEKGEVRGSFTNGTTRNLAQIYLAKFANPAGMMKESDNMFGESNNSGVAQMGVAGLSDTSSIKSGALEQANVDLAQEFTDMIVTQRGYQAVSRVVSTSNDILQELVNIGR